MNQNTKSRRDIRVLLVDDEQGFTSTLSKRLVRQGMLVSTAMDASEAFELLATVTFDVVVLDVQMPGVDGLQTLKAIKKNFHGVEVIMLTGAGTISQEIFSQGAGAFDFLSKPVPTDQLIERIHAAVHSEETGLHVIDNDNGAQPSNHRRPNQK